MHCNIWKEKMQGRGKARLHQGPILALAQAVEHESVAHLHSMHPSGACKHNTSNLQLGFLPCSQRSADCPRASSCQAALLDASSKT